MPRLQERFPHAVALEHDPAGRAALGSSDVAEALRSAETSLDLTLRFWADQHGFEATDAEAAILRDALAAASVEGDQ